MKEWRNGRISELRNNIRIEKLNRLKANERNKFGEKVKKGV